jgi:phenylacetic acid degradation operon negative regulatory protein
MLLTVLGEYVLPGNLTVWQETLVSALGALGFRREASRQAIARSIGAGWIKTERSGRRSQISLTDQGQEMLSAGAARIYGFGEPWEWDGRWLLIALRVPEERRDLRHWLRKQLAWEGFGSLGGGLWISPHVDREERIAALAENLDDAAMLVSFQAETGSVGEPQDLIKGAWDIDSVASSYRDFLKAFGSLRPRSPRAGFEAQTRLVHEWRRFPFLDPDLPPDLLPRRWPLGRAHALFEDRHRQWRDLAEDYFLSLQKEIALVAGPGASSNSSRRASK